MTLSTLRGTLDLSKHMDVQFIEMVMHMGSWYVHTGTGYIEHMCKSTKKLLSLHRFVYELENGPIPAGLQIDHIDGNRTNNFLCNLRLVTCQQNQWNHTKAKGYCWNKRDQKWMAYIYLNNKKKNLGYYDTEDEARAAYLDAKKIYHVINTPKI
jgi:hypothetical protein